MVSNMWFDHTKNMVEVTSIFLKEIKITNQKGDIMGVLTNQAALLRIMVPFWVDLTERNVASLAVLVAKWKLINLFSGSSQSNLEGLTCGPTKNQQPCNATEPMLLWIDRSPAPIAIVSTKRDKLLLRTWVALRTPHYGEFLFGVAERHFSVERVSQHGKQPEHHWQTCRTFYGTWQAIGAFGPWSRGGCQGLYNLVYPVTTHI